MGAGRGWYKFTIMPIMPKPHAFMRSCTHKIPTVCRQMPVDNSAGKFQRKTKIMGLLIFHVDAIHTMSGS